LSKAGYTEVYDDMNDYFQGLFLETGEFWGVTYFSETVKNKAFALINELSKANPLWNYEFFYNLSNPYSAQNGGKNGKIYTAQEFYDLCYIDNKYYENNSN